MATARPFFLAGLRGIAARSLRIGVALSGIFLPLTGIAGGLVDVIEYKNAVLDHYFITANAAEIDALDHGAQGGAWKRTGVSFIAWQIGEPPPGGSQTIDIPPDFMATCRFFGTDRYRVDGSRIGPNSHFYTAIPSECEYVKTAWPALADDGHTYPAWTSEGIAFYIPLPKANSCAIGTTPIYRLYNNGAGGSANHRISPTFVGMPLQGPGAWINEGLVMCAPQRAPLYETEVNNTLAQANPAPFTGEIRGQLSSINDVDWYAFDLTSPDQIASASFSILGSSSGMWGVTWYGPTIDHGTTLMTLSGRNLTAEKFDYTFPAFRLGRYYLKVAPVENAPPFLFDTATYVMRTSLAPFVP